MQAVYVRVKRRRSETVLADSLEADRWCNGRRSKRLRVSGDVSADDDDDASVDPSCSSVFRYLGSQPTDETSSSACDQRLERSSAEGTRGTLLVQPNQRAILLTAQNTNYSVGSRFLCD